jgi:hypothetical protein
MYTWRGTLLVVLVALVVAAVALAVILARPTVGLAPVGIVVAVL